MKTIIALLFVGSLAAQTPPMIPMATGGGPVGGATNLTTVGSVPYVSASGTLDQDAGFTYAPATDTLQLQTLSVTTISTGGPLAIRGGGVTYLVLGNGGASYMTFYGVGDISIGDQSAGDGGFRLDVQKSGSAGTLRVYDQTASTGSTLAVVRAGIAQSTNDLNQWQANNGTTILARVTSAGKVSSTLFGSETNCSSSAGPAVCAAAAAGSVVIPAAGTDVVVNTTAVTANSQIFAIFDQSLGTKLGVTCNSTTANPHIGARVAGTSFTIHANVSPITNPACFSYFIIN